MPDACCATTPVIENAPPAAPRKVVCPTNHQAGHAVEMLTIKALLALPLTVLTSAVYYFCPDAQCPTVYYSADGAQLFTEVHLRERVYQKHPQAAETCVCYCFQHSLGSMRRELWQTGTSQVIEQITAGIQAGQCACEVRNPQGVCCLGNIRRLLQQLQTEIMA